MPLSLKRSQSQSCDPHRAYITLELGDFEETVGRVDQDDLDTSRGSRSTNFTYKVTAKVPVDTVGVHRYPLEWNRRQEFQAPSAGSRSQSLGWIIVRVALSEGIKLVSIESPLVLKNMSDVDILCEVREHGGLSLLWRCIVPKDRGEQKAAFVSVPADIVQSLRGRNRSFGAVALSKDCNVEHEVDAPPTDIDVATRMSLPPPYSPSSIGKGVICEKNIDVRVLRSQRRFLQSESIPLNICGLRIGSFSLDQGSKSRHPSQKMVAVVPEQRMLIFRSSLTIENHLALPVQVQVRIKENLTGAGELSKTFDSVGWTDLGVLSCAENSRWAGARTTDTVEIRIRVYGHAGEPSRQFPSWSPPVTIPSEQIDGDATRATSRLAKLKVFDSSSVPLLISIALWRGVLPPEKVSSQDNIRNFSEKIPVASRVVSLFCPFWIVDGSGLDLQYKSRAFVAGQAEVDLRSRNDSTAQEGGTVFSLGLGELLDDKEFIHLPSRISFKVLMIGEEGSTQLFARRRLTREEPSRDAVSSWSDPIPLTMRNQAYCDISVPPPPKILSAGRTILGASDVEDPFSLRARLVHAPEALGGLHGTKLIHIVCRYAVVNELGREIEIRDNSSRLTPIVVPADGRPRPFHFDDSGPLRFRPIEFGWVWSGSFSVRRNRLELTMRLRHRLKRHTSIVNVEFHSKTAAGTCVIVFRTATHAPYRIENHSKYLSRYTHGMPLELKQSHITTANT